MNLPATILHVFPTFVRGGTQIRMASIMNALGDGFRHKIIALDGQYDAASALHPDVATLLDPPRRTLAPYFSTLARHVRSLRPALVATYNWGAIDMTLGARLAAECPVIHNECGFGPDEAVTMKQRRVLARRFILRTIFRTVVPSRALWTICRDQFRLPLSRVQLIPTGVDIERYQPSRDQAGRESLGIGPSTIVFGFVGSLRPEKNVPMLVRAFAATRLDDSRLMLVGDGPCRAEVESLARELGVAGRLILTGHVADPAPYLAMFDVFSLTSITEQVPNAQLEAMACALPVLATDVGDCRALLGDHAASWVSRSGDVDSFARKMHELAADEEKRQTLGAANRRRCLGHYSTTIMVQSFEMLYRTALGVR
ncbi:MAG: glycosyltransferase [Acidobacteria bacterium]|nr:glycosyltransferase [Acidobacteriota bacterium]